MQMSEACVLINSGVGLYTLMMQKPCIICGEAFYNFKGLNIKVNDKEELKKSIINVFNHNFKVDETKNTSFSILSRF